MPLRPRRKLIWLVLTGSLGIVSGRADVFDPAYTNTIAAMSNYITVAMAQNGVTGLSVALVDSNRVVWSQGFGQAMVESNVVANSDTVYRIGSVSKLFTTASVLKLWEDGRVDLEAPITNYIPEFATLPRFDGRRVPTVRECLNHLSGLPGDLFRDVFATAPWDGYNAWLLGELATDYPNYPPGFRSVYCNTGFQLAEEIVARVSGMSLNDYAQAHFFGPLGMTSSSYLKDKPNIAANRAHTYVSGVPLPEEFANAHGTGGMYSSVEDMAALIRLILAAGSFNGTNILAADTVAAMLTDQTTNIAMNVDSEFHCGLGWDTVMDTQLNYAGRLCFKGGETFTYEAEVGILLDRQLGVVVMQNATGTLPALAAHATLVQAVLDRDGLPQPTNFVPTVTAATNWTPAAIAAVTGTYVTAMGYASGYDLLTAAPDGSLTWTLNAHSASPTTNTGLVPHVDGWVYRTDQPGLQILPTNIAGRAVLVYCEAASYGEVQGFRGDLYAPPQISAAWSNRLNIAWLPVDMPLTDLYWAESALGMDLRLQLTNRLGMIWLASPSGTFVIAPSNDNLGFAAGSGVRRGTSVVITTTNGTEYLRNSSYTYARADSLPALLLGATTNGTLAADGIQWFSFHAVSGTRYCASVSNNTADVQLNFLGAAGAGTWTTNHTACTCPADGQYWLGLAASSVTPYNLTLDTAYIARIEPAPASVTLLVGQQQLFTADGFDQSGNAYPFPPLWSADGGTVATNGLYTATTPGAFTVTCSNTGGAVKGTVAVTAQPIPITGFTAQPSRAVTFPSYPTTLYTLQRRTNLVTDTWANVPGGGPLRGTGAPMVLSDTNTPPSPTLFYRLAYQVTP